MSFCEVLRVRDSYVTYLYGSLVEICRALFKSQSSGSFADRVVVCSVLLLYLGFVTHVTDLHGSLADTYRALSRVFIQLFCGLS